METLDSFGEWLRERRTVLRLTRVELAECVGCSVSALRKIEADERRPSRQLAELLASCLLITPEKQPLFVDAARGYRRVSFLGKPEPDTKEKTPLPSTPKNTNETKPTGPGWNLPTPATPLVGRETEVASLTHLLGDPNCRLLTLVGPGGIGKTRLAFEVACDVWERFADGVFLTSLAAMSDSELMVPAIAQAIGLNFAGPTEPRRQIFSYLRNKQVLLLLDNLEHLLDGVDLLVEILERAPGVKLLATSRERLELRGEWVFEVQGLPIPAESEVERLEKYSSVRLFLQRARQVQVDFELSAEVCHDIVRICHLVEGMPLAIELAATWLKVLSPAEIASEVGHSLDFLSASTRDLPARHRSMRATFDHSWKLLTEEEQGILLRLSAFRGGFRREAAELIANATLSTLATLVAKSLIRRSSTGRYDLHELIRQYVLERLEDHPEILKEVREGHTDFYLTFLGSEDERLRGLEQQKSLNVLTVEMDNLLVAWDWAIKQRKYELIRQTGRSIGRFFEVAGLFQEGIEQLEPLVQTLQAETRNDDLNRLLGLVLLQKGMLYFRKGQFVRAERLYRDSIAILRPTGDQALLADALTFLGVITYLEGEYAQSRDLLKEGLECARESNAKWFEAYAIYSLGYIDSLMGDYQKGYEKMLVGLDMWRAIGDPHYIALGLNFITPTIIKLGHFEEAKTVVWESIALCEKAKNRWGLGTAYRYLGSVSLAEGQYAEAQAHFHKSLEVFGEYTEGWDIALSLYYLGEAATMEGNLTEARIQFQKALQISFDANSIPIAIDSLLGLAQLYLQDGDLERVLELSYYILNHPSSSQETKDHANRLRAELEAQLTTAQIEVIQAHAGEKTLKAVVEELMQMATR